MKKQKSNKPKDKYPKDKYIDITFNNESVRLYETDYFKPIITDDMLNWTNDNRVILEDTKSYICSFCSEGMPVILSRGNPNITLEHYTTPKMLNSELDTIINNYCEG